MLKPGVQYVYESPDNGQTVYAREIGSTEKFIVGYTYPDKLESKRREYMQAFEEIIRIADEYPTLKSSLDQLMIVYNLVKDNNKKEEFHVRV